MLKKRLIASVIVKNGIVVQSIGFEKYLPVGSVDITIEYLNSWGIDEIFLLDIDASCENREPNYDMVASAAQKCFVPLSVGGGIKTNDHVRKLISSGADKVSVNQAAFENPEFITEAAEDFGDQCIVVSIDARKRSNGSYECFIQNGKISTGMDPAVAVKKAQLLGAGEILITSIDNDGAKCGYDLELIGLVNEAVTIPVIASGGVGAAVHLFQGLQEGRASAATAGNFFHFTEHSVILSKALLKKGNIPIRHDTYASYEGHGQNQDGRLQKLNDSYLEALKFKYIPKEVI